MLNFNEFKSLLPEETKRFIDNILPSVDYCFCGDNLHLVISFFYAAIYNMALKPKYDNFFSKFGFDKSANIVYRSQSDETIEDLNSLIDKIIPEYEDTAEYMMLTPIDILLYILKKYIYGDESIIFKSIFTEWKKNDDEFIKKLKEFNKSIKAEIEIELEPRIYKNLPINVISFLEVSSKIRIELASRSINTGIIDDALDYIPISLVLAVYFYNDTSVSIEMDINEQKIIKDYFKSNGITLKKLLNKIKLISLDKDTLKNSPRDFMTICRIYRQGYLDSEDGNMTVSKILERSFDRNFTKSTAVDKLFIEVANIEVFRDFDKTIRNIIRIQVDSSRDYFVNNFYEKLTNSMRSFAKYTFKIYALLLKKMEDGEQNLELLSKEDDADTLALLIASYKFNGKVSEFFIDHGITLQKVQELVEISISDKEIDKIKYNQFEAIKRFKRFFCDGVNEGKRTELLTVDDITYNLCDRNFNRSHIIESIFSELCVNEVDLSSNFLEQLQTYLREKETHHKIILTEELFHDLPVQTIKILEVVSGIHYYFEERLTDWPKEDIKSITLLCAIIKINVNDLGPYLESLDFTWEKISRCLTPSVIYVNFVTDIHNTDIDLLDREYREYIFGGKNAKRKREEITPLMLFANTFNREINDSVCLSKFLANFNKSYESIGDIDACQTFIREKERQKEEGAAKGFISSYKMTDNYLNIVFRFYTLLSEKFEEGSLKSDLITSLEDIKQVSFLLGLFYRNYIGSQTIREIFIKYNITKDSLLKLSGLNISSLDNLERLSIDFCGAKEAFKRYFIDGNEEARNKVFITDFIKRLFDKNINSSNFLENLASRVDINYEALRYEAMTGKDYESSLSVEERIQILSSTEVETIDLDNIENLISYGNSLTIHSKYIHEEFPRLLLSDTHKTSVESINSIIEKVRVSEEVTKPKKGLLARLFGYSQDQNVQPMINLRAIEELRGSIDYNIVTLSKELVGYDSIRKYIETYRRKNRFYYAAACESVSKLQAELYSIDSDSEDEYDTFLTTSSRLQIMSDKSNRFATTNHLMKQELFKINQIIVSHFITINALEMAKNDLLPLIGSELAIEKGIRTERQSIELSQNVMQLFQALLERNVEGAVQNVEQLRQFNLSDSIFESLNRDMQRYLQSVGQAVNLERRMANLEIPDLNFGVSVDDGGEGYEGISSLTLEQNEKKDGETLDAKKLEFLPKNPS